LKDNDGKQKKKQQQQYQTPILEPGRWKKFESCIFELFNFAGALL